MLAERIKGLREDVSTLTEESARTRRRLHDLEGFAQAYLDVQKVHRQSEERQYRRLTLAVAAGGALMSGAMVALTVVTLLVHAHP